MVSRNKFSSFICTLLKEGVFLNNMVKYSSSMFVESKM